MADSEPKPDRYAVIGHPVAHSRSPMIHEVFARQTSENMTYELLDVEPKDFEVAVRGFGAAGGKGLNVTVPHKPAAFELATELSDAAKRAGAVNTLSYLPGGAMRGDNTDGVGFMHDLTQNHGQSVAGKTILILGAGGATRGILDPILEAAPAAVLIANRTPERAADLVLEYQTDVPLSACRFDDLRTRDLSDIVINATSAGVRGESPPFPPDCIGAESFCYDLAYGLKGTPFVAWALEHGAGKAVQGWGMLVEQAAESFQIWRGTRPDTRALLEGIAA